MFARDDMEVTYFIFGFTHGVTLISLCPSNFAITKWSDHKNLLSKRVETFQVEKNYKVRKIPGFWV